MLDFLVALVKAVPASAPLVSAGALLYVGYLISKLGSNHLHDMPQMASDIHDVKSALTTQTDVLGEIRDGILVLKDRSDAAR